MLRFVNRYLNVRDLSLPMALFGKGFANELTKVSKANYANGELCDRVWGSGSCSHSEYGKQACAMEEVRAFRKEGMGCSDV